MLRFAPPAAPTAAPPAASSRSSADCPRPRSQRLLRPRPFSRHLAHPTQDLKYSADVGRSPQATVPFASDSNCIKHECAWVDGKSHHARIPASSGFELMCMSFPTVRTRARSSGLPTWRRRRCSFSFRGCDDEKVKQPGELAGSSTPAPAATAAVAVGPCDTGRPGEASGAICEREEGELQRAASPP